MGFQTKRKRYKYGGKHRCQFTHKRRNMSGGIKQGKLQMNRNIGPVNRKVKYVNEILEDTNMQEYTKSYLIKFADKYMAELVKEIDRQKAEFRRLEEIKRRKLKNREYDNLNYLLGDKLETDANFEPLVDKLDSKVIRTLLAYPPLYKKYESFINTYPAIKSQFDVTVSKTGKLVPKQGLYERAKYLFWPDENRPKVSPESPPESGETYNPIPPNQFDKAIAEKGTRRDVNFGETRNLIKTANKFLNENTRYDASVAAPAPAPADTVIKPKADKAYGMAAQLPGRGKGFDLFTEPPEYGLTAREKKQRQLIEQDPRYARVVDQPGEMIAPESYDIQYAFKNILFNEWLNDNRDYTTEDEKEIVERNISNRIGEFQNLSVDIGRGGSVKLSKVAKTHYGVYCTGIIPHEENIDGKIVKYDRFIVFIIDFLEKEGNRIVGELQLFDISKSLIKFPKKMYSLTVTFAAFYEPQFGNYRVFGDNELFDDNEDNRRYMITRCKWLNRKDRCKRYNMGFEYVNGETTAKDTNLYINGERVSNTIEDSRTFTNPKKMFGKRFGMMKFFDEMKYVNSREGFIAKYPDLSKEIVKFIENNDAKLLTVIPKDDFRYKTSIFGNPSENPWYNIQVFCKAKHLATKKYFASKEIYKDSD